MKSPKIVNWFTLLNTRVDPASLACFRILFGLNLSLYVFLLFPPAEIEYYFIQPKFFFSFSLFDILHLKPWPPSGMYIHFLVMGIAAIGIMLGIGYRLSLLIFFVTFGYTFLLEKCAYNNHYYLVLLLTMLLFFMRADSAFSISFVNKKNTRHGIPLWNILLLRAQFLILYFFAGVAKLTPDWLQGTQLRIWLDEISDRPFVGPLLTADWSSLLFSYTGLLFDLSIGFLLCYKKTRWWAFGLVIIFHAINKWIFDIGIFHYLGIASLILFMDPDQPRVMINKIRNRFRLPALRIKLTEDLKPTPPQAYYLIIIYLISQIIIPLRHLLYPGRKNWTHEGYRFAWNIKADDSGGYVRYFITDPRTQQTFQANPFEDITWHQMSMMSTQPDMILQYAHHLRKKYIQRGIVNPIIRAEALVSLNGRAIYPLIDPAINLAEIEYPLFSRANWILPHPDDYAKEKKKHIK